MKLKANACGTWPAGTHWTEGEVREIDLAADAVLPSFLSEVKSKAKSKKKAEPDAAAE